MKRMKIAILLVSLLLGMATAIPVAAQAPYEDPQGFAGLNIAAALAIGLAAIGAGIAVGMTAAAGIGAIAEKREMFGTVLILIAIGEGIVVYGLVFAVLMLFARV